MKSLLFTVETNTSHLSTEPIAMLAHFTGKSRVQAARKWPFGARFSTRQSRLPLTPMQQRSDRWVHLTSHETSRCRPAPRSSARNNNGNEPSALTRQDLRQRNIEFPLKRNHDDRAPRAQRNCRSRQYPVGAEHDTETQTEHEIQHSNDNLCRHGPFRASKRKVEKVGWSNHRVKRPPEKTEERSRQKTGVPSPYPEIQEKRQDNGNPA